MEILTWQDYRAFGGPVVVIPVQVTAQGGLVAIPPPSGKSYRLIWRARPDQTPPPKGGVSVVAFRKEVAA